MKKNEKFGRLLNKGIRYVQAETGWAIFKIEMEIAVRVNYASESVRQWRKGCFLPSREVLYSIAAFCCQHGELRSDWAENFLLAAGLTSFDVTVFLEEHSVDLASKHRRRIFFCYDTSNQRDLRLVISLAHGLSDYECFFDQVSPNFQKHKQQIEEELAESDVIVLLLSVEAYHNEFVLWQLKRIHDLLEYQPAQRAFLTIRVDFREDLSPHLESLLTVSEWSFWRSEKDYDHLINEITTWLNTREFPFNALAYADFLAEETPAISVEGAVPIPSPYALQLPRGPIAADSCYYIRRDSDLDLNERLSFPPFTVTIRGNRQSGKTSLLNQALIGARNSGFGVAVIDFQLYELYWDDPDQFYYQFCARIASDLGIHIDPADHWNEKYGVMLRSEKFMADHILSAVDGPVLLAIDEVENLLGKPVGEAFMKMLRAWHGYRATSTLWKKLSMVLVTSTEPYALIKDLNNSPFNVSEYVSVQDFTYAELSQLNSCYQEPAPPSLLPKLFEWLHGHPFLSQVAFYLVASGKNTIDSLFVEDDIEIGPFGEHLRTLHSRFLTNPVLVDGLKQILGSNERPPEDMVYRLESAGLIRREAQQIYPRCELYKTFFRNLFGD